MASVSSIPSTVARYFNRDRKARNSNNGGKNNAPGSFWLNDEIYKTHLRLIANISADQRTKMDKKGFFYRLGHSTAEERREELSRIP